jgi:hypothetical protein
LNVGYVLIGVGALVFIVGLLGCCGSVRESRLLLGLVCHIEKKTESLSNIDFVFV